MASDVDICNIALSRLGDSATVASIDPPEGSPQAGHCAQWYPVCRDMLLEMRNWSFALKRVSLAQLAMPWPEWSYAYGVPADCIKPIAVLPAQAGNDYSVSLHGLTSAFTGDTNDRLSTASAYVPRDYVLEATEVGEKIIYTDEPDAVLRYLYRVIDPTKFTPLFVDAFGWLLASYLAGPIIKGDAGAAAGQTCYKNFALALSSAGDADANSRQVRAKQVVPWIANR